MSTLRTFAAIAVTALTAGIAVAQGPRLGKKTSEADIAAWDVSILGDGTGLPSGSGTAAQGAPIYAQKCAACHGEAGKGGPSAPLVGGGPLDRIEANKTIANFWSHPTTVFDFIRRAMPWQQPRTLTNDEVYALSAYIFSLNKLIDEKEVMDAHTLPKVKMPNRNNFIIRFPKEI